MIQPSLYLEPFNGLCNRMRAIMYWSCFADLTGREFCLVWNKGEGFEGIPYQDLFVLPEHWRCLVDAEVEGILASETDELYLNHSLSSRAYPSKEPEPMVIPPGLFLPRAKYGNHSTEVSCSICLIEHLTGLGCKVHHMKHSRCGPLESFFWKYLACDEAEMHITFLNPDDIWSTADFLANAGAALQTRLYRITEKTT